MMHGLTNLNNHLTFVNVGFRCYNVNLATGTTNGACILQEGTCCVVVYSLICCKVGSELVVPHCSL